MKKVILTFAILFSMIQAAEAAQSKLFTTAAFETALKSNGAFVVAFHSDSCGSCKVQKPNLESALLEEPLIPVDGLMANFEATAEFRKHLEKPVRGPSTILVFKNGKEISRILGETNKEKIRDLISSAIAKN